MQHGLEREFDYRRLFNSLPNSYIIMRADDPLFTIVEENDAHVAVSLTDRSAVLGKPVLEAFPDNSEKYKQTGVSDLVESFRKVIKTGKPDTMPLLHYDLKDKQGKFIEKWWRVTHYPLFDERHTVTHLYQATEDVTDETLAKDRLSKAQSQLDSALAIGLVSTWYWDIANDIVLGDKNLAKSFGISSELAAKGLPLSAFIASIYHEDRDQVAAAIQTCIAEKGDFEQEYRTVTHKGQVSWVIARGSVECDVHGKPAYFLGVLVDITDRKKAEAELEKTEAMFNALFESKIVSIAMVNLDGRILQANKKFLTTFGYTTKDLKQGITSQQLTPRQSKAKTVDIYESLRTTGAMEPTEKEYIRKDGQLIPILIGAAMLPNSADTFMAFLLDISENKELKALNVAKDEFIALASHQLRTPATAVKQYLGILIDEFAGPVSAAQLEYLHTAYESNERQLTIINDLLKTAQLDTKGYRLNVSDCDLGLMVQGIIAQFKPICDTRNQKIVFREPASPLIVKVDAPELSLAIINLVENASKYTIPSHDITIKISRKGRFVRIIVADQGVGIAKKDQAAIFEKFTRVNNPLSDTVNGSGLGLYWVKRIVELHSGTITVDSTPNEGATFTMELPA